MMSVIGHFFLNFVVGASSTWLQDLRRNNMRERPGRFSPHARSFSPPGGILKICLFATVSIIVMETLVSD
jgi:hypothetical protein